MYDFTLLFVLSLAEPDRSGGGGGGGGGTGRDGTGRSGQLTLSVLL